ncbi:MAG: HAD family phosphatase [Bacteroidales bacterium]|nr:HAD family phosphatase [Bacteroidales bacterium]MBN2820794.1 HAD family phosphatase [Bacteroidales bacterium]
MKISHPEKIDFQSIRNIIFDWGGVITNINYHATVNAFVELGLKDFNSYFTQEQQNSLFRSFEVGELSNEELRNEIRKAIGKPVTDKQIDEAWCAMLLDTPSKNIDLIRKVSEKFRIFLLSNTNDIHVPYYNKLLKEALNIDYPALFEKSYYSHQVGKRKPNADVFEYVLDDSNLKPGETLFIDDTEMHIDTAASLGINALYLKPGLDIHIVFRYAGISI